MTTKAPPKLETRDIKDVEILAVGKWHGTGCPDEGCGFDVAKLKAIAQANNAALGNLDPPIKLGHADDQKLLQEDGYPAAGYLENFRVVKDKLFADLRAVPVRIADLMAAGAWTKRSVELNEDFDVAGTTYPIIITGMALLGADLPAVSSIGDIEDLYQSQSLKAAPNAKRFLFEADAEFDADAEFATLLTELDAIQTRAERLIKSKTGAPVLRQLWRAYKEGLNRSVKGSKLAAGAAHMKSVRVLSKQEAGFAEGSGAAGKNCGVCRWFAQWEGGGDSGGYCALVEGAIGSADVCRRFEPAPVGMTHEEDDTMLTNIAKALGLGETADEAAVLAAVTKLTSAVGSSATVRQTLGLAEDADETALLAAIGALKGAAAGAPAVAELSTALSIAQGKILSLEGRNAAADAERVVDEAVRDRRLLPAQREEALKFALRDTEGFKAFVATQPQVGPETGERGGSGGGSDPNLAELEPTQIELEVGRQMYGATKSDADIKISLMRQKAADRGIRLPADFGKEAKS